MLGLTMTLGESASADSSQGEVLAPYRAAHEHLSDLLQRHDWLLKRRLVRGRARESGDVLSFATITEQEVQRLLDAPPPEASDDDVAMIERTLEQLERRIDARVELSRQHGVRLPL